jgi:hypothetical protein
MAGFKSSCAAEPIHWARAYPWSREVHEFSVRVMAETIFLPPLYAGIKDLALAIPRRSRS